MTNHRSPGADRISCYHCGGTGRGCGVGCGRLGGVTFITPVMPALFSPVVAARRLSSDSDAGKNAMVASIASQQVRYARLFANGRRALRCSPQIGRQGTARPTSYEIAFDRRLLTAASAVAAASGAAEAQQDEPPQIESSSRRPRAR